MLICQFMTVMLPHSGRVWYRNCDAFIGRSKHMAERLVLLTSGHGSRVRISLTEKFFIALNF